MYDANNKKRQSTKIIKIALIISRLIIIAGVYYVFFWDSSPWATGPKQPDLITGQSATGADTLTSNYYIGEKVTTEGVLTPVESFTTFTHRFVTDEGQEFGLKSREHDLYQYTGTVQVRGTVDDFKDELPILQVTEIFGQQAADNETATGGTNNEEFYLFEDVRLGFDLSISEGYEVAQREGNIVLVDTSQDTEQVVLTVSPFACSSTEALKDCAALQQKFEDYGNETFVSSNNIRFYNLTETNTRAAFNGNSYGYYLTPVSERNLVDFANLMVFVDEVRLQQALEDEVGSLCQNIDHTMSDIFSLAASYGDNGKAELTVEGTTDTGMEATCQVVARLGTTIQFTLKSFTVSDQEATAEPTDSPTTGSTEQSPTPEDQQDEDEDQSAPGDDAAAIAPPDQEDEPTNDRLSYESVRGYTLSFSNQGVSYAGQVRNEATDLGVDGISCSYQVNLIERERADQVETDPDIIIYECTGEPNQGDIAANNLLYVGEANDAHFIAKYLNNNLSTTQLAVQ